MEDQQKVWDAIAPEWNKFKEPGKKTLDFLKKQKGKVLDFGCGSGNYLSEIKNGKMYMVDFSKEMIKLAKKKSKKRKINAEFFISDLIKTPFEDNYFDSVISIAAIHCIPTKTKRKKALKEFFRILKPGAIGKILVWNRNSGFFKRKPKEKFIAWRNKGKRYYYLYEKKEFINLLKEIGFEILKEKEKENIVVIVRKPISSPPS